MESYLEMVEGMIPSISIIIPTFNEEGNIKALLAKIFETSQIDGFKYEIVLIDDGNDATGFIAENFGARVIRGQRKGLGQAIIDGIKASNYDIVVNMDADFQHDPQDIPRLIKPIVTKGIDFVIGSKYVKGGDTSGWSFFRKLVSTVSGYFWHLPLGIHDANSGFFAFKKEILDGVELKADSWKIMLEILVKGKWISKLEVPIKFGNREHGESKNSLKQVLVLSFHMVKLVLHKYRFLKFGMVGAIFSGFHFGLLYSLTEYGNLYYLLSAICSGVMTATLAYAINHRWTFERSKIRHGWFGGWLEYVGVCGIAELTYLGMLALFTEVFHIYYMISAGMAVCINYPFKYMVVSRLVWKTRFKDSSDSKDFEWRAFYKANLFRRAWKRKITHKVADFVNAQPVGTILDIGCGSSPTVVFLNHNHYVGIDANKDKVQYMNDKNLPECEFMQGKESKLSEYQDGSFDTILCLEVIEHLKQPVKTIKLMASKLKNGGKLVIATPDNNEVMWHIVEKAQKILQPTYHTSKHVRLFSQSNLDNICKRQGLRNIGVERVALGMDMILYYEKRQIDGR